MAEKKSGLDKAIGYLGIGASIMGILLMLWLFFVFNGLIDAMHEVSIGQVDSMIAMLEDSLMIVNATSNSVDAMGSFATNSSATLQHSASAMDGMAGAIDMLAFSLAAIPYMPSEATSPLYSASADMKNVAVSMQETADSMGEATGEALSAGLGIQQLEGEIEQSIANMEKTKKQIDDIHFTAKTGLVMGSLLLMMLFALNGLTFYRQLKT